MAKDATADGKTCPMCGQKFAATLVRCPVDSVLLTEPDPLIGTVLDGKYEIREIIGQGGMSVIYKARDIGLERVVALKLLKTHLVADPANLKRFQREAVTASRLRHRNIIGIYGFGVSESGAPYLVLEYVEGRTLADLLESEGPLDTSRAADSFAQIADALVYAHGQGVIHRDLKPSNVILTTSGPDAGCVRILDLGTAKWLNPVFQQNLTLQGEVLGTLMYMAPEQKRGESVDGRADIYALGYMLHEATARDGHSAPEFADVIKRATADEPGSRYQTADQFKEDLEEACALSSGKRTQPSWIKKRSGRPWLIAFGATAAVVGLFSAWFSINEQVRLEQIVSIEKTLHFPVRDIISTQLKLAGLRADDTQLQSAAHIYKQEIIPRLPLLGPEDWLLVRDALWQYGIVACRLIDDDTAIEMLDRLTRQKKIAPEQSPARRDFEAAQVDLRSRISEITLKLPRHPGKLFRLADRFADAPPDWLRARMLYSYAYAFLDKTEGHNPEKEDALLRLSDRICSMAIALNEWSFIGPVLERSLKNPMLNRPECKDVRVALLIKKAGYLQTQHDLPAVEVVLKEVLKREDVLGKYDLNVVCHLTSILMAQGKNDEASALVERAKKTGSADKQRMFILSTVGGRVALELNNPQRAEAELRSAREATGEGLALYSNPLLAENIAASASVMQRLHNDAEAVALIDNVLSQRRKLGLKPDIIDGDLVAHEGIVLSQMGRHAEAKQKLKEALSLPIQPGPRHGALMVLYDEAMAEGRLKLAKRCCDQAKEIDPELKFPHTPAALDMRVRLAQILLKEKQPEQACQLLRGLSKELEEKAPTCTAVQCAQICWRAQGAAGEALQNGSANKELAAMYGDLERVGAMYKAKFAPGKPAVKGGGNS